MPKSEVSKRDGKKPALGLIASCPKCEDGLLRKIVTKSGTTFYGCNNYDKGCRFTIPAVIAGKNLNVRSVRELCTEKKTSVVAGFRSKAGRLFNARLRFDDALHVVFDFTGIPRQDDQQGSGHENLSSDRS
jgi:DNA topoisomerase-3